VRGLCAEERHWFTGASRAHQRCGEVGIDVLLRVEQTLSESDEAFALTSLIVADLPDPELLCRSGEGSNDTLQTTRNRVLLAARSSMILGREQEARSMLEEQHKRAVERGDAHTQGAIEYELGRLFDSSGNLEQAAEYLERALHRDHSNHRLLTQAYLAQVESKRPGRKDVTRALVEQTRQELDGLRGHPILRARAYNDLGLALRRLGETASALKAHQQAYELQLATLGGNHPEVASSRHNIAISYKQESRLLMSRKQPEQAAKSFGLARDQLQKAAKILRNLPFTHPAEVKVLGSLADTYDRLGQVDLASEAYRGAVQRSQAIAGPGDGRMVEPLFNLGQFLVKKRRFEQGLEPLEHGLELAQSGRGTSAQTVFGIHITLGYANHKLRQEAHACRQYKAALDLEGSPQVSHEQLQSVRKQVDKLCGDKPVAREDGR